MTKTNHAMLVELRRFVVAHQEMQIAALAPRETNENLTNHSNSCPIYKGKKCICKFDP
jgi:hypothetical protein